MEKKKTFRNRTTHWLDLVFMPICQANSDIIAPCTNSSTVSRRSRFEDTAELNLYSASHTSWAAVLCKTQVTLQYPEEFVCHQCATLHIHLCYLSILYTPELAIICGLNNFQGLTFCTSMAYCTSMCRKMEMKCTWEEAASLQIILSPYSILYTFQHGRIYSQRRPYMCHCWTLHYSVICKLMYKD